MWVPEAEAERSAQRFADRLGSDSGPGSELATARKVTSRVLRTVSSFALTVGPESGSRGAASVWGRTGVTRFDGREGVVSLDGGAVSTLPGAGARIGERQGGCGP